MTSRSEPAVAIGTVLVGRYRIDALLGTGGMADVFRATDTHSGRTVAIKILHGQSVNNREAVKRLKREGEVLSALRSPAIVAVEAAFEIETGVFLVMELLEGETLGARMKRGPMTPAALAPVVTGMVAGLAAAHTQNVIHRDLKPDNVFLVPDHASGREGAIRVKLLDFGISKVWYGEKLTQTGQVLGTPRYMSPEQLGAEVDVDPRIDIYALGVILYEALAGTPPFLATTPTDLIVAILHGKVAPLRSVRPELTPAIEAVVMRAMARTRDARFASARELADAFLDAAGIGESVRLAPRKGLETRALGSAKLDDEQSGVIHAGLPAPDQVTGSAVKPGTFSELPAYTAPPPAATILAPMAFDANGMPVAPGALGSLGSPSPPVATSVPVPMTTPPQGTDSTALAAPSPPPQAPAPIGATRDAAPAAAFARTIPRTSISQLPPEPIVPQASPTATPRLPEPAPPPRISQMPYHAPEASPRTPTASMRPAARTSAWWWIAIGVVGLLAGGLTAGAVIALLHWWRPDESTTPPPPALASTPDASAPDAAVAPVDAAVVIPEGRDPRRPDRPITAAATRESDPPDTDPSEPPAEEPDAGHRRRGSGESGGGGSSEPEPMDPLSLAARALRSGDPTGCVDILDDLIAQGATPVALRRRADCLLRLGDRTEAIRDYQRFCRLAPDHPAIGEVREVLEGLGQSCP